jgi:hypothetical protein
VDEGQGQSSSSQSEVKMGKQQTDASFGHFAHFIYSVTVRLKHVANSIEEFKSRAATPMHQETIQLLMVWYSPTNQRNWCCS